MARLMQVGERLNNHAIGFHEPLRTLFYSAAPAPHAKPCHGTFLPTASILTSSLQSSGRQLPQGSTRAPRPNNWAANDANIFCK
jgi:hypothetical protein